MIKILSHRNEKKNTRTNVSRKAGNLPSTQSSFFMMEPASTGRYCFITPNTGSQIGKGAFSVAYRLLPFQPGGPQAEEEEERSLS